MSDNPNSRGVSREVLSLTNQNRITVPNGSSLSNPQRKGSLIWDSRLKNLYISNGEEWQAIVTGDRDPTIVTYTTSPAPFVVPAGITVITAYCQGGGGGGGGGGTGYNPDLPINRPGGGGGGGGSGTYQEFIFNVTEGDVLDITVGSQGAGGSGGTIDSESPFLILATAGTDGGDTTIIRSGVDLARAYGGKGGGFGTGPEASPPYEVGGDGGAGEYGGGGGGGKTTAGTGGIGTLKDGSNGVGVLGGAGAPGNIAGYDVIAGGNGGAGGSPNHGNGGGGGCPTTVPLLGGIGLTGEGGDGGDSNSGGDGEPGGNATRYGAGGGGGGAGASHQDTGGAGGNGKGGYVVLVY